MRLGNEGENDVCELLACLHPSHGFNNKHVYLSRLPITPINSKLQTPTRHIYNPVHLARHRNACRSRRLSNHSRNTCFHPESPNGQCQGNTSFFFGKHKRSKEVGV